MIDHRPTPIPRAILVAGVVVGILLVGCGFLWFVPRIGTVGLVWTAFMLLLVAFHLYNLVR